MTPERWQQVKKVLEEALALSRDARPAYLQTVCVGDPELRREVESFLAVTEEAHSEFLEAPAIGRPPALPDDALEMTESPSTGSVDEVRPLDLAPYTKVRVSTQTSDYQITVVAPLDLEVIVQGGSRFPQPTRARLHRQDAITVGSPLKLQVGSRKVVTTAVVAVEIVE